MASDWAFWNSLDWSRLSGTLRAPMFLFDQPSMWYRWHTSFFLYPHFGHNLTFIFSDPSNPYVLFLEPHFCVISYVWPLCFPAVHLLCTIFIFCFPFQVMHSNVKLSCKELNKQRWLMVVYIRPEWSPDVRISEWVGVGGTWLQLMCCAILHCCVPNFKRQESGWRLEIRGRRWLHR